jgi:hypothetical protein
MLYEEREKEAFRAAETGNLSLLRVFVEDKASIDRKLYKPLTEKLSYEYVLLENYYLLEILKDVLSSLDKLIEESTAPATRDEFSFDCSTYNEELAVQLEQMIVNVESYIENSYVQQLDPKRDMSVDLKLKFDRSQIDPLQKCYFLVDDFKQRRVRVGNGENLEPIKETAAYFAQHLKKEVEYFKAKPGENLKTYKSRIKYFKTAIESCFEWHLNQAIQAGGEYKKTKTKVYDDLRLKQERALKRLCSQEGLESLQSDLQSHEELLTRDAETYSLELDKPVSIYRAVADYLKGDSDHKELILRKKAIEMLRANLSPQDFLEILENRTMEDGCSSPEEIKALMHVLNRPIIIIDDDDKILNQQEYLGLEGGQPIFIYYDDRMKHYESRMLDGTKTSEEILAALEVASTDHLAIVSIAGLKSGKELKQTAEAQFFRQKECLPILGLTYERVAGDGSCFYIAVARSLDDGEDVAFLCNEVADMIQGDPKLHEIIELLEDQTIDDYIAAIRNTSVWAGDLEINALMRVLNRPIVIIGIDGEIRNQDEVDKFTGEPIFVHYNHELKRYDAFLINRTKPAKRILSELKSQPDAKNFPLLSGVRTQARKRAEIKKKRFKEEREKRTAFIEDFFIPINIRDGKGNTFLHYAVSNNNIAMVKFLIDQGAIKHLANSEGKTPLMLACESENNEIIELIERRFGLSTAIELYARPIGATPTMLTSMESETKNRSDKIDFAQLAIESINKADVDLLQVLIDDSDITSKAQAKYNAYIKINLIAQIRAELQNIASKNLDYVIQTLKDEFNTLRDDGCDILESEVLQTNIILNKFEALCRSDLEDGAIELAIVENIKQITKLLGQSGKELNTTKYKKLMLGEFDRICVATKKDIRSFDSKKVVGRLKSPAAEVEESTIKEQELTTFVSEKEKLERKLEIVVENRAAVQKRKKELLEKRAEKLGSLAESADREALVARWNLNQEEGKKQFLAMALSPTSRDWGEQKLLLHLAFEQEFYKGVDFLFDCGADIFLPYDIGGKRELLQLHAEQYKHLLISAIKEMCSLMEELNSKRYFPSKQKEISEIIQCLKGYLKEHEGRSVNHVDVRMFGSWLAMRAREGRQKSPIVNIVRYSQAYQNMIEPLNLELFLKEVTEILQNTFVGISGEKGSRFFSLLHWFKDTYEDIEIDVQTAIDSDVLAKGREFLYNYKQSMLEEPYSETAGLEEKTDSQARIIEDLKQKCKEEQQARQQAQQARQEAENTKNRITQDLRQQILMLSELLNQRQEQREASEDPLPRPPSPGR